MSLTETTAVRSETSDQATASADSRHNESDDANQDGAEQNAPLSLSVADIQGFLGFGDAPNNPRPPKADDTRQPKGDDTNDSAKVKDGAGAAAALLAGLGGKGGAGPSYMGEEISATCEPKHHVIAEGDTLEKIAREHLGPGASDADVLKHIAEIAKINKLDINAPLEQNKDLVLPGHREDGGFVTYTRSLFGEQQHVVWRDGTTLSGNTLRLPNGESARLTKEELDSFTKQPNSITVTGEESVRHWTLDGKRVSEFLEMNRDGSSTQRVYGADGSKTETIINKDREKSSTEWDTAGRVKAVNYPDGTSSTFEYGENNQVVAYTDRDGYKWSREPGTNDWTTTKKIGIWGHGWEYTARQHGDVSVDAGTGSVTIESKDNGIITTTAKDGTESYDYPSLDPQQFGELVNRNWDRLDRDNNGYLTITEVDRAVADSTFRGQDAQMVVALKRAYSKLWAMEDGSFFEKIRGIERANVEKLPEQIANFTKQQEQARHVEDFMQERFDQFDADHNGTLSDEELNGAANLSDMTDADKALLAEFRSNETIFKLRSMGIFGLMQNREIEKDSLAKYDDIVNETKFGKAMGEIDSWLDATEVAVEGENRQLFGKGDPMESIKPGAINQGGVGDCVFLSSLASLADQNPQAVMDMIKENSNGTYTVTFPGEDPITVDAPTDAEVALYVTGKEYGVWPAVMEKAFGRWMDKDTTIDSEGADEGQMVDFGIEVLSGKDTDVEYPEDFSEEEIKEIIERAEDQDLMIVAGVGSNPEDARGGDLPTGHAYSVLGINAETGNIIIRNPWGHGELQDEDGNALDGKNDGVFEVSVAEFKERFEDWSVQRT